MNPSDFTCPVPNIVVLEFVYFVNKSVGVVECPVFVFALSFLRRSGSVVEHCVKSTKCCGFNSQGTHILTNLFLH